ncbi:FGGY-family carbohydrate kinase [Pseudonocardia sp.]|uniref:FGGY-family carbohydrate kinase n=1 Tax=Pseudonocardia sp. TaxID=60912 RepID=UPI0031FC9EC2
MVGRFVTAVRRCGIADAAPAASAITGQMQDLVMLDEQGPGFDRRCSTSTPGDEGTVRLERLVDLATGPTELLMLASLAGERSPLRDPAASGAVIGLRPTTTPAELYRAATERIGYSLKEQATLITADRETAGHEHEPIPLSDDGARFPYSSEEHRRHTRPANSSGSSGTGRCSVHIAPQ